MMTVQKALLPMLAVIVAIGLAIGVFSSSAQAQVLAPDASEGSPARDPSGSELFSSDFRQQRSIDRAQYRGALGDLLVADRIEKEAAQAAEMQARQEAIRQQVQDTLAQPTDYGVRLEALKRPPPTQMVNPDGTPYVDSAAGDQQPGDQLPGNNSDGLIQSSGDGPIQ